MNQPDLPLLRRVLNGVLGKVVSEVMYHPANEESLVIRFGDVTEFASWVAIRSAQLLNETVHLEYEFVLHCQGHFAILSGGSDEIILSTDDPLLGGMFDYEDEFDAIQAMLSKWLVGSAVSEVEVSDHTIKFNLDNGLRIATYPVRLPRVEVPLKVNRDPLYESEGMTRHVFMSFTDNVKHQDVLYCDGTVRRDWLVIVGYEYNAIKNPWITIHYPTYLVEKGERSGT